MSHERATFLLLLIPRGRKGGKKSMRKIDATAAKRDHI
jgi:hypothetical protein